MTRRGDMEFGMRAVDASGANEVGGRKIFDPS